ncbi:hypothetical protein CHS0354_006916 [Potamilus streckersoni]|uniref:chorismate synthase n=1 Tax=Potamilus streckersoni TaxID=2493646 RepID=A0AAE0TFB0_9BIVA|nr:hypothetical protein CHS0354_006916 [Potamilus streckersoni]
MATVYRPGHADYTYEARYGIRDVRGGGRSSNRESAARVAAGAIARNLLHDFTVADTLAWVDTVYNVQASVNPDTVSLNDIESIAVRCPDKAAAAEMEKAILKAKEDGSPVFDKITADLAKALISINATRSFSVGLGEDAVKLTGIEHNDPFDTDGRRVFTKTNRAGGVLGGITNGETLYGTVSVKPVSTVSSKQQTITKDKQKTTLEAKGRHDPCVLPRAVPIVEAMVNLVLADHIMSCAVSTVDRLKKNIYVRTIHIFRLTKHYGRN